MTSDEFVSKYSTLAIIGALGSKVFPSVVMAQAALESGWGGSELSNPVNNNFFGIKADSSWHGQKINLPTTEYINGVATRVNSYFRVYRDASEGFRDHINFLYENPRYKSHGVFDAATPEAQTAALQAAGYATDPSYAGKLNSTISAHNMKKLDQKKTLCESLLAL